MASRTPLLLFIATATIVAACRAEPFSPLPAGSVLRDHDDPECVDTIYVDSSQTFAGGSAAPMDGDEDGDECHVVIVWE